ncbi:MAG: 2-amino-4-hydroxy-6-hydroxymethyldihydropteridine diphosphokinase [Candidatus Cloacimonetes bacterium]|nr:2-amino-4-hydroxy-6-hydroxymethyldihydropteridine diphosphokinase [Candidatus Cloacimonadota bacterium]
MRAILSLGSNLGNRNDSINQAINQIANLPNTIVQKQSQIIETEPWGHILQPAFLNCVVIIETVLNPYDLLDSLLNIENKLGRIRTEKWGARTIDIDIIFYENQVIKTDNLTIPHPYMHERLFVLDCLNEICPEYMHPIFKKNIKELINNIKQG